jgi:hypothetical protein
MAPEAMPQPSCAGLWRRTVCGARAFVGVDMVRIRGQQSACEVMRVSIAHSLRPTHRLPRLVGGMTPPVEAVLEPAEGRLTSMILTWSYRCFLFAPES